RWSSFSARPDGEITLISPLKSIRIYLGRKQKREGMPAGRYALDISATELLGYQRCKRAWHIQSRNGLNLDKVGPTAVALHLGSALHHAFAMQAEGRDPMEALEEYFKGEEERLATNYRNQVGAVVSREEQEKLRESEELSRQLTQRYFDHWGWKQPFAPYE